MAKLVHLSGEFEGRVLELNADRITIGRLADNDLRIDDKTISGHHCTLTSDGKEFILKDLNSTNGSRVNGRRIVEMRLSNGDNVRLGSVEIRYESETAKTSQPLPPPTRGVDLTTVTPPSVPPTTMSSASPFPRRENKTSWVLNAVIGLLALIVIVVLVLVLMRLNGQQP